MTTEHIRSVLAGALLMAVAVLGPAQLATASTEPSTEPPATEAPEDTTEPTDTTAATGEVSEPGGASPAIWIGVIVLVAAAIIWAVRQGATTAEPSPPDDAERPSTGR